MSDPEQITAFQTDLEKLIERYRLEFNLTLAGAIGTLEIVKLDLWKEQNSTK
jgi:hypothetical protein